ncbi:MAG TPA: ATP-binding protein [Vicinamibacterales bacterium]|nr:ATP-binding protein [Vicinamibacterales bacterium]
MADTSVWLPRRAEASLRRALEDSPAVCLLGPRQSGKSALAQHYDPARPYFTFDDPALLAAASADPAGLIAGLPPAVTIDEIQRVPGILPVIKLSIDRDRRPGRFLLTGSADLLLLPPVSESLAGRLEIVRLHPLTEAEKERRPGRFLEHFLAGSLKPRVHSGEPALGELAHRLLQGGFPEAIRRPPSRLRPWHRAYVDALIDRDARDVANLRNLDHLRALLTMLAHQTAQLLNINAAAKHLGIRRETVENYLAAIERLFLVRRLAAWHTNEVRRLVKAPKVHFVDSGIAAALTGLTADGWNLERDRFGHVLESFVVQQLVAQAAWTDPELGFWHYRDKDGTEVDVVVTRGRKVWGVEVKAGATVRETDGRGLRRLAHAAGRHFQGGVLLHAGTSALPTADRRVLAVPLAQLWTL